MNICEVLAKHRILSIFLVSICFYIYGIERCEMFSNSSRSSFERQNSSQETWIRLKQCKQPVVAPYNEDIVPYLKGARSVDCASVFTTKTSKVHAPAFTIVDGNVLIRLQDIGFPCCFESFSKARNNAIMFSSKCTRIKRRRTVISSDVEYFELTCGNDTTTVYQDMFAVAHKKGVKQVVSSPGLKRKLNILIMGFDSTSQQNFYRQMPESRKFLLNELAAVQLTRYNKVGYNTNPNAAALLTGYSYKDLQKINATLKAPDELPLIWKEFSRTGYVTSSIEDCSVWPVLRGFPIPTTNYSYMPMSILSAHLFSNNPSHKELVLCHGPRSTLASMLNFLENIVNVSRSNHQSFFQFLWTSKYSHNNLAGLRRLDSTFIATLKRLKKLNVLESTALFVVGDHGYQPFKNKYSFTPSGEMEDKLPVAYVVLPKWFQNEFPNFQKNLVENANKLTTAYDIHQTLKDLLALETLSEESSRKNEKPFGISLFNKISPERTCSHAGIPLQFCKQCYPKLRIPVSSSLAREAAEFFVNLLNDLTRPYRDQCEELVLQHIHFAFKMDARDVFTTFCNNQEYYNTKISCDFTDPVEVVQVSFLTEPNSTEHFGEAMKLPNGKWVESENPVSSKQCASLLKQMGNA